MSLLYVFYLKEPVGVPYSERSVSEYRKHDIIYLHFCDKDLNANKLMTKRMIKWMANITN